MLLQCLAALLLLGDPLGLEGCQHSVQPQPLQALWARREAKCSERALRLPAQEDSGKLQAGPGNDRLMAAPLKHWGLEFLHSPHQTETWRPCIEVGKNDARRFLFSLGQDSL